MILYALSRLPKFFRRSTFILVGILLALSAGGRGDRIAYGQNNINYTNIIRDIYQAKQTDDKVAMVFWFSGDAFEKLLKQDSSLTEGQVKSFSNILSPYIILGVLSGQETTPGSIEFQSLELVQNIVTITDAAGKQYRPLPNNQIDPNLNSLFTTMKPILSQMVGNAGDNLHFMIFDGKDAQGNMIANPTQDGQLIADVGSQRFLFELPLASLLPEKTDPETGRTFPGNYLYNPFTGRKLPALPAEQL